MTFGAPKEGSPWGSIADVDQTAADAIVARSLAAGVNFIDTADVYSFGDSERLLGQSLQNLGVKRRTWSSPPRFMARWARAPTTAAPRAATSWIRSRKAWSGCRPTTSISTRSTAPTGHADRRDPAGAGRPDPPGLVRYVGVSNWQAWRIAKALGISERQGYARFETVQAYYSIAGRDLERELVPLMNSEERSA
jgi:hypothetical protein